MKKTNDKGFSYSLIAIISIVALVAVVGLASNSGNDGTVQESVVHSENAPSNLAGEAFTSTGDARIGVTRHFDPFSPRPNSKDLVTLEVIVPPGREYYFIEEHFPEGFNVLDAGSGAQVGNTIRWVKLYGATSTELTYRLQAPANSGTYTFSGEYYIEGMSEALNIGDKTELVVGSPIIADLDGDGCIVLAEISAYINHWLNGRVTHADLAYALMRWRQGC